MGCLKFEQKVYQKLGNGTETSYQYEADRRRLQNMKVTSPFNNTTVLDNNYRYDALSNVLSVSNTAVPQPGQLGGSSQNSYSYDILNRLVSATGSFSGVDESATYQLNMQYDDLHNIQNKALSQTSSVNAGSSYSNAYSYGTKPHAPTKVGEDLLTYDANGNLTYHKKADNTFLQYKWDEENRLMASDNFGLTAQYSYDASGMRVLKSSADNSKTIFINGAPAGYTYHEDNYTAYIGGHFEAKEGRYTKHYFNGAERLASKIGVGTLDNSEAKGYYQAGGIDYGKRYTDAYKDFKQIAKDNQLPPGPPNIKYIYAQEFMAGLQSNNETVTDLTLLNQLSLDEWMEINSEKDPGPPVCEPPFCDTGGNIDTGSLPENEVYFFHPDHLGSTSYITNIAGETVQFNSYLPFGESFVSQKRTSTISSYLFNSKEVDPETGLYYYGARYYNSYVSTWLSVDPLALDGSHLNARSNTGGVFDDMNLNVYAYVHNRPINAIDPNGKDIYRLNKSGKLVLYKRTKENYFIFQDNEGNEIFRTNSTKGIKKNWEKFGTYSKWLEAKKDVSSELATNSKIRKEIRDRAEEKGFSTEIYKGGIDELFEKSKKEHESRSEDGWFDLVLSIFSGESSNPSKPKILLSLYKIFTGKEATSDVSQKLNERKEELKEAQERGKQGNVYKEILDKITGAKPPN